MTLKTRDVKFVYVWVSESKNSIALGLFGLAWSFFFYDKFLPF